MAHCAQQSVEHIKPYQRWRLQNGDSNGDARDRRQRRSQQRWLRHERAVLRAIGASGGMSQSGNDFDTKAAGSLARPPELKARVIAFRTVATP